MPVRVLILAGTPESLSVARSLAEWPQVQTITSFAGVAPRRHEPPGIVRTGGFGGTAGFATFLAEESIDCVVNAVHPFAARMSDTAATMCLKSGIPCLRLCRPPWHAGSGDDWHAVNYIEDAVAALPSGALVLVTVGRYWQACLARPDVSFIIRSISPLAVEAANIQTWVAPPPYSLADERALFERFGVTQLITKNAGGEAGQTKLEVARERQIPVWLINRPFEAAKLVSNSSAELLELLRELPEFGGRC